MSMRILVSAALAFAAPAVSFADGPTRVVSLDYCADQYVLALADRADILALSPGADDDYAYLRDQAVGLRQVRPTVEEVIALGPDLVVRHWGGDARAMAAFARLGVPTHQIGWSNDLESVREETMRAAEAMGQPQRGRALADEMDARLAALRARAPSDEHRPSMLYLTPGGATTGTGTLIHDVLEAAGGRNYGAADGASGWRTLSLEHLVFERPDMVAAAFFTGFAETSDRWSPARHPLAREFLADRPAAWIDGATMACPAWFVLDAAEAIADLRESAP